MYAFGMEMPGRKWQFSDYRYSHNGHQDEDAVFVGAQSAEYWMYDSRIGRRWEMDPVRKTYESPYAAFHDNPILFSDLFGDDPVKKLNAFQKLGNLFRGESYKNRANKYAVKNKIDDSQIHVSEGKVTIDESYYTQRSTGTKDGVLTGEFELNEQHTVFSSKDDKISRPVMSGINGYVKWQIDGIRSILNRGFYGTGTGGHGLDAYTKRLVQMDNSLAEIAEFLESINPNLTIKPESVFSSETRERAEEKLKEEGEKTAFQHAPDGVSSKPEVPNANTVQARIRKDTSLIFPIDGVSGYSMEVNYNKDQLNKTGVIKSNSEKLIKAK